MIIGDRVRQARELHGLTQTVLAEAIGVSQPTVARIERSGRLTDDMLGPLSQELGFPPAWFRSQPILIAEGSLRHRAHSRTSATDRATARRWAELSLEVYEHLAAGLKLPPIRLPGAVEEPEHIETAAQDVRAALGIPPDQPIKNLTRTLEHSGVLVLALPHERDEDGQDAFSTRVEDRPLIATLEGVPPDRLRLSTAHEVGHLVLHASAAMGGQEVEREANRFAGALLLPADVARDELSGPFTISRLLELKERWGMAMRALVVRAYELDLISERTYHRWFRTLNDRYGGTSEPGSESIPLERPRALAQMAEMQWGRLSSRSIAEQLHFGPLVAAGIARCYQASPREPLSGEHSASVTPLRR